MTTATPFHVGERIRLEELIGWTFTGVSGRPGKDVDSVRRYTKGDWVMEIQALADRKRRAPVVAIRTREQDDEWWRDERRNQRPGTKRK